MIFPVETIILSFSAIFLVVMLVIKLRRYAKVDILLGISALIFFASAYLLLDHFALIFPESIREAVKTNSRLLFGWLWWLSVAFLVNVLIHRWVYQKRLTPEGEPAIPMLLQHVISILIFVLAVILTVRFVYNQSITAIIAASGAVALVLGYSARSLLDELFAGLSIHADSPFEIGDLIQINGEWGYIKNINWRSITYLDMDQNYVVVPNTVVAASNIRNLDRPNTMTRRTFYFRAEYNVPPKVIVEEAEAAMRECPHITPHPWNFVAFYDSDESGVRYKTHFHVAHYDDWYVASDELMNAMWYRFSRKGIRFAHQRRLNFTSVEDEKRGLPNSAYDEANWHDLIERFKQVPVFEGMTKDDMEELAKSAKLHIVGPPERIIRAGSSRTSMFIIAVGQADVYQVDRTGKETWMAAAGESEFLGLMSLLTGAAQRTTIRARVETVVWEVSSESLHALFERKPDIMDNIAKNVVKWQAEEDEALNAIEMSKQQEARIIRKRTSFLSDRITRFFNRQKKDKNSDSNEYSKY